MSIVRSGIIVGGGHEGAKISIFDDSAGDTGGYYVFIEEPGGGAFDNWFENLHVLKVNLEDYEVHWNDDGTETP
ncbi:hypothetical protein [Orrella dioscoreae]|uniref:hypothetical protein n=1 Tax=Orrella dioscoreae TaxID=1851544 RepID=UPI00130014AA|nr:hypothetical protein [Orrella dioscoreae]